MDAVQGTRGSLSCIEACNALGLPRASYYRMHERRNNPQRAAPRLRERATRALSEAEEKQVLDALHTPRFADLAIPQVYATLLEEGIYLASMRTMYRILEKYSEVRERRDQLRSSVYKKPELLATGPNQVWSWDITKLRGPRKWSYYYLYVVLDIFSRCVVG